MQAAGSWNVADDYRDAGKDPIWAADLFRQVIEETRAAQPQVRVQLAAALAAAKIF